MATVTRPGDLDFLEAGSPPFADLLEFRIDSLRDELDRLDELLARHEFPALITVRRSDEGGDGDLTDNERLSLYRHFLPHAALVDLEVASLEKEAFHALAAEAKDAGTGVIASAHWFDGWPGLPVPVEAIRRAGELGADIAKVAVTLETLPQLLELAGAVHGAITSGASKISAMGMSGCGLGKLSRLVLAKAGSRLNYGYLREANAPGQWSAEELKRLLGETSAP